MTRCPRLLVIADASQTMTVTLKSWLPADSVDTDDCRFRTSVYGAMMQILPWRARCEPVHQVPYFLTARREYHISCQCNAGNHQPGQCHH